MITVKPCPFCGHDDVEIDEVGTPNTRLPARSAAPSARSCQLLWSLLERIRARADNAYCDYIGQLRRDECLGWEIKVERGKFGEAELKAHCAAAEKLGRHRALHEAANMLAEVLRSTTKVTGRGKRSLPKVRVDRRVGGREQQCWRTTFT